MKKLTFIIIACSILFAKPVISQEAADSSKITLADTINSANSPLQELKEDLKASVDAFDTAKTLNEKVSSSNHIELIAKKWNDQWVANYYACYCLTLLSYIEKDEKKRDAYLDDAEIYFNKAKEEYKSDYDEIYVLRAMVANARLAVNPGSRHKKYGDLFNENIDKGKSLQPNNPRIYYLQGNSLYYTPRMFGGGAKNAVTYFEKAEILYQDEKNDDIFKPYWGKKQNTDMLKKCSDEIK